MKLCILAPEFLPIWGGVGTYVVELVKNLPKDYDVHVLTPERTSLGLDDAKSSDYDFEEYFGDNVKVHFISKASDTFFYNLKFQFSCLKEVPKLIENEKIELIHSHTAHMPDILLQFSRVKVPTVTTIHTTIKGQRFGTKASELKFHDLELSEKMTFLLYPALRSIENFYFKKERAYIVPSKWMSNLIKESYPKLKNMDTRVIPYLIDTNEFKPNGEERKSDRREEILFTGRLISNKGVSYIVNAIPEVLKEHPEVKFTFIGPGYFKPYHKKLKKLGVKSKNYSFLGYKSYSEIAEYYKKADIFLAPTLYDNLPIRILEAMSSGVSVIATEVCGIPEMIESGKNGLLINPKSTKELIEGITLLLSDEKYRRKLGINARKTVEEKFSSELSIKKTMKFYEEILEKC